MRLITLYYYGVMTTENFARLHTCRPSELLQTMYHGSQRRLQGFHTTPLQSEFH